MHPVKSVNGVVTFFRPICGANTAARSGSPRVRPPENDSFKRSRRLALGQPEHTGLPRGLLPAPIYFLPNGGAGDGVVGG